MPLLLLVLGLVGVIVPEQFGGQQELGAVFIALAVVIFFVQLLWGIFVARKVKNMSKDFHQDFHSRFHDRW